MLYLHFCGFMRKTFKPESFCKQLSVKMYFQTPGRQRQRLHVFTFTGKASTITGVSLEASSAESHSNAARLTSLCVGPRSIAGSLSVTPAHDFTEIVDLTFRAPLQDDSRGFLLQMGSGRLLCLLNEAVTCLCCGAHVTAT